MALKIQNSRQLLKRTTVSGATPTVFTGSTDFTDGTWGVDDIYAGELYLNMADKKLWFGWETTGGTGVELIYPQSGSTTPPFTGGSGNCITDFYLTNMYGCSPITIWDDLILEQGVTINSFNTGSTITMDDTGGNSILHLDLANLSGGNTFVRLNRFGDVDMGTDDTTDFYTSTYTPNSFNRYLNYGGGYSVLRDIFVSAPDLRSVEQVTDFTNFITQTSNLDTTTGDLTYSVVLNDASPQSSFQMTKNDINLTLAGAVQSELQFGTLVNDYDIRSRVGTNNEQSYHLQSQKISNGQYQQILVTENTPNNTSANVNLQTPGSGSSILTMGITSGTTTSQMRFGPVGGNPTAYADIRVSGNTEAYIEMEENLVTISPALLVLGNISGSTLFGNLSGTTDTSKQITVTFDGGGSPVVSGSSTFIQVPYNATITGWNIFSDVSGSCVIDVWQSTFASYPPTVANTITGTEKPTLSSQNKNQDLNLTTWTTSVTAGDILYFNVDSASTVTRVVLTINLTKI